MAAEVEAPTDFLYTDVPSVYGNKWMGGHRKDGKKFYLIMSVHGKRKGHKNTKCVQRNGLRQGAMRWQLVLPGFRLFHEREMREKSKRRSAPTSKAKGLRQILVERGLYVDGMTQVNVDPCLSMDDVLGGCPDFASETTAMQDLLEKRGHILVMSPKYHPEVAGEGVECNLGYMKIGYRRKFNDLKPKHLQANVERAVASVTLDLVRKFARRARDYMRAYRDPSNPMLHQDIEDMLKEVKTHRNIAELDGAFFNRLWAELHPAAHAAATVS